MAYFVDFGHAMLLTQTTTGLPVAAEGVITTPNLACELQ